MQSESILYCDMAADEQCFRDVRTARLTSIATELTTRTDSDI